jgi:hypothetical protein
LDHVAATEVDPDVSDALPWSGWAEEHQVTGEQVTRTDLGGGVVLICGDAREDLADLAVGVPHQSGAVVRERSLVAEHVR